MTLQVCRRSLGLGRESLNYCLFRADVALPIAYCRLWRLALHIDAAISTAPINPVMVSGMCMCTPMNMIAASAPVAQVK